MNILLPIHSSTYFALAYKHGAKILALSLAVLSLTNCGGKASYAPAPVSISAAGSLNRYSVSDVQRTVIKSGSLTVKTNNVREAGETVENIVATAGGHMTSMSERDDKTKYANFEIRVPAQRLVSTMDEISQLGKVSYRSISVKDATDEAIKQTARLNHLKVRIERLKALYKSASKLTDKLQIEEALAEIEQEIFSMEEAIKQMQKVSSFSKLSLRISQAKIRGPLGVVKDSGTWSLKKLFTIRE